MRRRAASWGLRAPDAYRQVAGFIAIAMPTAMPNVIAPKMATRAACLIDSIISIS